MTMLRTLALVVAALALAACSRGAPADAAARVAFDRAAAEAELLAWARGKYNSDGMGLIEPVDTFFGDYSGDGQPDALVVSYYDMGGSGAGVGVALFRNDAGRMVHQRDVEDVFGQEPREVRFERGRITLTTTVAGPDDPHCCPTEPRQWTINTE
jgi:hypothetical protein